MDTVATTFQAGNASRDRNVLDDADLRLLAVLQGGLSLESRPYTAVAERVGISESEVLVRIGRLQACGIIRRFGIVVRHHEVGYSANAMVVWDVPDDQVAELGRCLAGFDFITLCYRRPRRLPQWRYNLYCMIHGRSRDAVLANLEWMVNHCGLSSLPYEVLFSRRRFKQCGARYFDPSATTAHDVAQTATGCPPIGRTADGRA